MEDTCGSLMNEFANYRQQMLDILKKNAKEDDNYAIKTTITENVEAKSSITNKNFQRQEKKFSLKVLIFPSF